MKIVYRSPNSEKEFEEYFKFRWKQLRKPLGLARGSEQDELDDTAFQIAAFNNQDIIGIGRLHIENNNAGRIRYMAVDEQFRKRGIGSQLLNELEIIARDRQILSCWLYARKEAMHFYKKNNYVVKGDAKSDLEIPHARMEKNLLHN